MCLCVALWIECKNSIHLHPTHTTVRVRVCVCVSEKEREIFAGTPRRFAGPDVAITSRLFSSVSLLTPVFEVSVGSCRSILCTYGQMFEVGHSLKSDNSQLHKMSKKINKSVFKYAFDAEVKSKWPLFCAFRPC